MHPAKFKRLLHASVFAAFGGGLALSLSSPSYALPVTATEGTHMAYLSTGPSDNAVGTTEDITNSNSNENDVATLTLNFDIADPGSENIGGQSTIFPFNATLLFDVNVLTSETITGTNFNDAGVARLNGNVISAGAIGGSNGVAGETDAGLFDLIPTVGPDGSFFGFGETDFFTVSTPILPGSHTLEFQVGDDADSIVDTAILIDNIRVLFEAADPILAQTISFEELIEGFEDFTLDFGPGEGLIQPAAITTNTASGNVSIVTGPQFTALGIPEPATLSLLGLGVLGASALGLRRRRKA